MAKSTKAKSNMKLEIDELHRNQNHILEAVKNLNERLEKMEEKLDDQKCDEFKEILNSQRMIDEIIVKNSDDIALLMKDKAMNGQNIIKETMKKVVEDIQNIDKKIQLLDMKEKESLDRVRKCSYYNKGFCKLQKECPFYHPETLCSQFESEGICLKTICRDRHQRPCRYWRRGECFRGETCEFSHRLIRNELYLQEHKKCDKCDNVNINLYYCNFCGKNFCCECTKEQAHDEQFTKFTEIVDCEQLHDTITKEDYSPDQEIALEKEKVEQSLYCDCGKSCSEDTFKCEECRKFFCRSCPAGPIENELQCIKCMFDDEMMITSTPNNSGIEILL